MNRIKTQFAVIGGGPAGVCGALAAARNGISTILITDRPVLGGNSSSEIRVWTRGAVGAGNFYSEEMGIWGELKLTNLYRNPDCNPIFWDEVLLDAVLREPNLQLFLNTEISDICVESQKVRSVSGVQQGTERHICVEADVFLDATGDASIGYMAGLPYYLGDAYIASKETQIPQKTELLGCSIMFYTKEEDHPVSFIPPDYAYDIDRIAGLINYGGRIVNEKMGGSDCWWFEYGGELDTISQLQDITLELKKLVMGVWNYIKNSGKFDAECYTLEWFGSIPGKRESRRIATDYILTEEDIRSGRQFPDGAFYGGWYMDIHPSGGIQDTRKENCIQIPVNVYQIPLRCLFNSSVPNLLFAGRDIGAERSAFVSSRVMNTCALSGQAAGELAFQMLRSGKNASELTDTDVIEIRRRLLREDVFIPGADLEDAEDLGRTANVLASSFHNGACKAGLDTLAVEHGTFVSFPGIPGKTAVLDIDADQNTTLKWEWFSSHLPNRFCPGQSAGKASFPVVKGRNEIPLPVPKEAGNRFCTLVFEAAEGVRILCTESGRTGFLCGRQDSPVYMEPMLSYPGEADLYAPQRVTGLHNRPWDAPNQWKAASSDLAPWLELYWQEPQMIREIRLFLDPSLNEELPSSRTKYWQESHHFVPRNGMPSALIRDMSIQAQKEDGSWTEIARLKENCQRLVILPLADPIRTQALRLDIKKTWGEAPAIYHIGVYEKPL